MKSSTTAKATLTAFLLLLLLGGNVAFASTPAKTMTISVSGTVQDAGDQKYWVHGGSLVSGTILGQILVTASSPSSTAPTISYSLRAEVNGLSANGNAQFQISGLTSGGTPVQVNGQAQIVGMQSQPLPVGCTSTCTSGIPVFFVGVGVFNTTIGGSQTQQIASTMLFESPYFSPWGGPILMVSTDGAIIVAATYDKATLDWKGTTLAGTIKGALGGTSVQGNMAISSNEHENFVTGVTDYDNGTMSFTNMSPKYLNVQGTFQGTSTIPKPGGFACMVVQWLYSTPCTQDCSAYLGSLGLPVIPGTCTQTGFQSFGKFALQGQRTSEGWGQATTVTGSYSTTWSSPALGFVTAAFATCTYQGNGD
jgi:hypothetical protein